MAPASLCCFWRDDTLDANRLKAIAVETGGRVPGGLVVIGALSLYLDFINLFLLLAASLAALNLSSKGVDSLDATYFNPDADHRGRGDRCAAGRMHRAAGAHRFPRRRKRPQFPPRRRAG